MNETVLSSRQSYVLNTVNQSEGLLREEIQEKISKLYPVSKPTLIRDLNVLINNGLVKTSGKAKTTRYLPTSDSPLLRRFDIDSYFALDPDQRIGAKKSFDFGLFSYLHDLFLSDELEELGKYSQSYEEKTRLLGSDILKRELERFTIELSWKSSKIEGNTYTLLETESLIKEQKEAAGKSKDEATMILNHKEALQEIIRNEKQFRQITVSEVSQLHNLLVKNLGITSGIRKHPVGITGTVYKPPDNEHQIREILEKTIYIVNKTKNPFEKALIVHFMIPYIQPYPDGNKRTARMLTNAILLAHDLSPLSYRSVDEDEFKKALILFYEEGSIFYIKRLFVEQIKFANENYFR